MNPIAVNVTQGKPVFMGVAEAAAAGSAATSSVADLFCQMLAAAHAGVAASVEPPGESTEGECELPKDTTGDSSDVSVLAATMVPVPVPTAIEIAPAAEIPVAPIAAKAEALHAEVPPAINAALVQDSVDAAEAIAVPMVAESPNAPEPPAVSLAMQAALARAGLGVEGALTARRFGDTAVTFARPVQPVEAVPEESVVPLREGAPPSVKSVQAEPEQAETGSDTDNSPRELFKPMASLQSPKSGESTLFDLNTPVFGGAEIHAAVRTRTEPVFQAAQADVPQSVSVRDVGDVVVRSVQYLSGRTEDVVTVRLVPQSLGELRIAVYSGERGMEVVLTAANNAARDALETNLAGLREALGREGMTIERVSVQVFAPFDAGHQPASSQQHQQGGASSSARQPNTAYRESSGSPPQQQSNHEQQARRQQHAGRLNMWV